MGAAITLLMYCGFLDACTKLKDNGRLIYVNWIMGIVLIPALCVGSVAEFAYFDVPYLFVPVSEAFKTLRELE